MARLACISVRQQPPNTFTSLPSSHNTLLRNRRAHRHNLKHLSIQHYLIYPEDPLNAAQLSKTRAPSSSPTPQGSQPSPTVPQDAPPQPQYLRAQRIYRRRATALCHPLSHLGCRRNISAGTSASRLQCLVSLDQRRLHQDSELLSKGKENGFEWGWIDTCCIDKTSSAELSEAINSMFRVSLVACAC